jgi:hypothetical protein
MASWFPGINLYGNVFVNSFSANGSIGHNIISDGGNQPQVSDFNLGEQ